MKDKKDNCVLMFSGGRDSTLAAVRLAGKYKKLTLVTITSDHLIGIKSVEQRLSELKKWLPSESRWLQIAQPKDLLTDTTFYKPTCLPCHHSYVVVGAKIADKFNTEDIAFGYAGYQSTWPEQTTYATEKLNYLLRSIGKNLILPVINIMEKDVAIKELSKHKLSTIALEQKCTQQIKNTPLSSSELEDEISLWADSLGKTLHVRENMECKILTETLAEHF